jgi:hypothetical protein
MKTVRSTPRQRQDISDRRRHAQDRRVYQRLSAVLWSDDGRSREKFADLLGVSTRQVLGRTIGAVANVPAVAEAAADQVAGFVLAILPDFLYKRYEPR